MARQSENAELLSKRAYRYACRQACTDEWTGQKHPHRMNGRDITSECLCSEQLQLNKRKSILREDDNICANADADRCRSSAARRRASSSWYFSC